MANTVHATTTRPYTDGPDSIAPHTTILGMPAGKFRALQRVGKVREATDGEIARARGEDAPPAPPAAKPRRRRASAKPRKAAAAG